jgi:hypothetical protein
MRKVVAVIVFMVFAVGFSSAQALNQVRIDVKKNQLKEVINSGSLELYFNKNIDRGEVERNAKFYESYFDVNYTASSGQALIVFKDQSQMSIRIVERFLVSNSISEVIVGGEKMTRQEFVDQFLN